MKKEQQDKLNNFFDELSYNVDPAEVLRIQEEQKSERDKLDYLIHRTFEQNKSGKELLLIWEKILIMQPGATPEMNKIEIGIREGYKQFIRGIKLTIAKVEKGE